MRWMRIFLQIEAELQALLHSSGLYTTSLKTECANSNDACHRDGSPLQIFNGSGEEVQENGPIEIPSLLWSSPKCSPSSETLALSEDSNVHDEEYQYNGTFFAEDFGAAEAGDGGHDRCLQVDQDIAAWHSEHLNVKEAGFFGKLSDSTYGEFDINDSKDSYRLDNHTTKGFNRGDSSKYREEPRSYRQESRYNSQIRAEERLEQIRSEQAEKELQECTFIPNTGRPPKGNEGRNHFLPVEKRLLAFPGRRKDATMKRILQEREEAEKLECTFEPRLICPPDERIKSKDGWRPLYKRLQSEWQKKQDIQRAALRKAEENLTFRPEICPASRTIAEKKRKDDLYRSNKLIGQANFIGKNTKTRNTKEETRPLFKPNIDHKSRQILLTSNQIPSDFLSRQKYYGLKKQQQMSKVESESSHSEEFSFHPNVNRRIAAILALSDKRFDQLVESSEERYARLSGLQSATKEATLTATDLSIPEGQELHAPKLNPKSLKIAKSLSSRCSITDIESEHAARLARLEKRRQEAELRIQKECTFSPDIRKPKVYGYYQESIPSRPSKQLDMGDCVKENRLSLLSRQFAEKRSKIEEKAQEARRQLEEKEYQECSFTPQTLPAPLHTFQQPLEVKGMDKFLENRAAAQRIKVEKQRRQAKVWNLHPQARCGATIPKPFRLSSTKDQQRTKT